MKKKNPKNPVIKMEGEGEGEERRDMSFPAISNF
jgi:hypothetical protein